MYLVYIDESGNTGLNLKDSQQPIFVLAALLIEEKKWFELEQEFHAILLKHFNGTIPSKCELHAIQLKVGSGVFKHLALQQRITLRNDMLALVQKHKIPVVYRRIVKKSFEKFCLETYGAGIHIDPYIMALPFVCTEVDDYLMNQAGNSLGLFIFDEQKEYFIHVERSIKMLRLDKKSSLKTSNIIEKGFFVDSQKSFAVQLTDIVAYYIRKYEEDKNGVKVSDIDKQTFPVLKGLISMQEKAALQDVYDWVRQTYEEQ